MRFFVILEVRHREQKLVIVFICARVRRVDLRLQIGGAGTGCLAVFRGGRDVGLRYIFVLHVCF